MVTTISNSNIIGDTVLVIRQVLASGTTDPISATRSSDSKFIMTSYPDRPVEYPLLTVKGAPGETVVLGSNSEAMEVPINLEIRVWSRNEKEKDSLTGQVIDTLRTSQKGTIPISGTESFGLFDPVIGPGTDVDETGIEGVKSKVIPARYSFITV